MSNKPNGVLRHRLPATRRSVTRKIEMLSPGGTWDMYLNLSFFGNGQPGEVFLTVGKSGSTTSGFCDMFGVLASMLLQVGVPIAHVAEKMRHTKFEPHGLGPDGEELYSSMLDAVAVAMVDLTEDNQADPFRDCLGNPVDWGSSDPTVD